MYYYFYLPGYSLKMMPVGLLLKLQPVAPTIGPPNTYTGDMSRETKYFKYL